MTWNNEDMIGPRIKAGCYARNISISQLSREVGIARRNMQLIMGKESIRSKYLPLLAEQLECNDRWLNTGTGAPPEWWHEPKIEVPAPMIPSLSAELTRLVNEDQKSLRASISDPDIPRGPVADVGDQRDELIRAQSVYITRQSDEIRRLQRLLAERTKPAPREGDNP